MSVPENSKLTCRFVLPRVLLTYRNLPVHLFMTAEVFYRHSSQLICLFMLQEKSEYNDKNTYNHNFNGLYCICDRPYPDPEDEVKQCFSIK